MQLRAFIVLASLVACGTGPGPDTTDDETDETDVETDTDETSSTDDTDDTDETVSTDETDETDETDDVVVDPCFADPGTLTIGTGELWEEFTPLVSGQVLEMVNGPQGGHHLTIALQAVNVSNLAIIELRITDVASSTVVSADDPFQFNVLLTPLAGPGTTWACSGVHTNMTGVLDFSTLGADTADETPWDLLCGHEVRIDLSVRDPDGMRAVTQSTTVVVQPDPENGPYCVEG